MRDKGRHGAVGIWARRAMAWLLALTMVAGILPAASRPAQAEDWAQEYLDRLVSWGVMRGDMDGSLNSGAEISRGEFVAMVNRAYGYNEAGANPFTDVDERSWYADDISIAYNVGYFTGTSRTTANPEDGLTREQATLLLARNMMMEGTPGEILDFSDGRDFSDWSRNIIRSATEAEIISGYPDGSFRPQDNITRGEVAAMLVRALGTPIYQPGDYELGNVYGNVTVATSGVNLRNSVIAGDLYLTGGIGLGDLLLENVTVLGRIVASGAGESNKGDSSIILRNVEAESMVVDSIGNQFVTLRAEGDTKINTTSVRTPAYLEDTTRADYGLLYIELAGEEGTSLQVAGNIKEVVNRTPKSSLLVARGTADKVTIDEEAVGATMSIDLGARVKELNLDVATNVGGRGDIDHVTVSANGVTVATVPDSVDIRPGVSSTVAGQTMDNMTSAEYSSDPRLLAGYPEARNIAPTTAEAVFSTNKRGTIYWAVSALADGSVSEEDLLNPPTYGGIILVSGSLSASASNTEYTARLNKLTSDGSYYLSAVMVDSRGEHSPVKVTAFTTPDNTVPAFTTGYPVMSRITSDSGQVTVMTNKNCQLYYAVLPKGSTAPKEADFKAGAITGNLGYGTIDAVKNSTMPFQVNNVPLDEQADYDLYLWLTDYDGAQSSRVQKLSFKTTDGTPPVIRDIEQMGAKSNTVTMRVVLSEPGSLHWAVVDENGNFFRPVTTGGAIPGMADPAAKSQVKAGIGAIKNGSATVSRADTNVNFTITGLEEQTTYDLYYVAEDRAGNFSDQVMKMQIHTQDSKPPEVVRQEFTEYNGEDNTKDPLPNTDIRLIFSESIQGFDVIQGGVRDNFQKFLEVYQTNLANNTLENWGIFLRDHIKLKEVDSRNGALTDAPERGGLDWQEGDPWVVDYKYASVTIEDKQMVITFPTNSRDPSRSALNLDSGKTYVFRLDNISDTAIIPNIMRNGNVNPTFKTVFAQVNMVEVEKGNKTVNGEEVRMDAIFTLDPKSTSKVGEDERWDMILWCNKSSAFEVYRMAEDQEGNEVEAWNKLGTTSVVAHDDALTGVSLRYHIETTSGQPTFDTLSNLSEDLTYYYGIRFVRIGELTDYDSWNDTVNMQVGIVAGSSGELGVLAFDVDNEWPNIEENGIASIGQWFSNTGTVADLMTMRVPFTDRNVPAFEKDSPKFTVGSSRVDMELTLEREGTIYYVIVPKTQLRPAVTNRAEGAAAGSSITIGIGEYVDNDYQNRPDTYIPLDGADRELYPGHAGSADNPLVSPNSLRITNPNFGSNQDVRYGTVPYTTITQTISVERLHPETEYYAYFVLRGRGNAYSTVQCYQFTTTKVDTPTVDLQLSNPDVNITTSTDAYVYYAWVQTSDLPAWITGNFSGNYLAKPLPAGTTMTVLDALRTTTPDGNGKTYFDEYARDTFKKQMQTYISGTGGTGIGTLPTDSDKIEELPEGEPRLVSSDKLTQGLEYVLLAAARHTFGEEYGFAAIRGIFMKDPDAPAYSGDPKVPISVPLDTLKAYDPSTGAEVPQEIWRANPALYVYSGTVTINFDKAVYFVDRNNAGTDRKAVWTKKPDDGTGNTTDETGTAVYICDVIGDGNNKFGVKGTGAKRATSSFTLTFDKIGIGTSIRFFQDGYICNADGVYTTTALVLRFNPALQADAYGQDSYLENFVIPGFEVQWQTATGG